MNWINALPLPLHSETLVVETVVTRGDRVVRAYETYIVYNGLLIFHMDFYL